MSGWRLLAALLALEAALTALDLARGGGGIAPEERHNAHAGLLLACGHWDKILELQYRPFCGGCSVEAAMAAPLYRLLGASVGAWKAVPALFHLLVVAAGGALVARQDRRALLAWGALVLGTPAFARDVAMTGWGNHAESLGLGLAAGALLLGQRRWLCWPLAGAIATFAAWFCHTATWAPVALVVAAVGLSWRYAPLVLVGMPLGLAPAWWALRAQPEAAAAARDWWTGLELAPFAELRRWLWDDWVASGLWPGQAGWPSALWWGGLAALALYGAVRSLSAPDSRRFLPLALGALLCAYLLRYDLWRDTLPLQEYDAFNLRYRVPLLGLVMACAALAPGRAVLPIAALLGGAGLILRIAAWAPAATPLGATVYAEDGWPDRTVPTGQPPQRLDRLMGRPADIEAARRFLAEHADPLPECRALHEAELQRRQGLSSP